MTPENEYQARLLARMVLEGMSSEPTTPWASEVSQSFPEVQIELRSMVRSITHKIFLDQAALAALIADKVAQAASTVSIEREVEKAVAEEVSLLRATIIRTVQDKVRLAIDHAVARELGTKPSEIARHITARLWATVAKMFDKE